MDVNFDKINKFYNKPSEKCLFVPERGPRYGVQCNEPTKNCNY